MEKIKTTPEIVKLQELQSLLQDEGIDSQIIDNSSPYVDASGNSIYYSLLVKNEDVENALVIVKKFDKSSEKPKDCSWCPECGSENLSKTVSKHKYSSPAFLVIGIIALVVGAVVPLGPLFGWILMIGGLFGIIQFFRGHTSEEYVCGDCGHKFKRY